MGDDERQKEGELVEVEHFGPTSPVTQELEKVQTHPLRLVTATWLAGGLLLIFALTVLPPVIAGLFTTLDSEYVDFVKWLVAVEVASLGAAFGFFFAEERSR